MSETKDCVSLNIDNLLLALPSRPSKPSIFRVRDDLRKINEKLYDPEILSIGPFHHGRDHLKNMEHYKLRYLKLLLKRMNETNIDRYVTQIRSMEEKARRCYEDPINFNSDELIQMMILDGFFIIELIRNFGIPDFLGEESDRIHWNEQVLSQLRHDLILIENQIPFFVLNTLFSMTKSDHLDDDIRGLFQLLIFNPSKPPTDAQQSKELLPDNKIYHLVGLLHHFVCSFPETKTCSCLKKEEEMLTINCATELQEVGLKLENYTENLFLKIEFIDGVLKMPRFYVYDGSESFLRNIMAYEKSFKDDQSKYFTDYAFLMQCLINSAKDVKILRCQGIIANLLGDDEMVYSMFNQFGKSTTSPCHFCYDEVFNKVNMRYRSRRNRWKANLRTNYFNGPWKTIAFLASLMLLLLTFTQTIFSIISYTNPN